MSKVSARLATAAELKSVTVWFLQERQRDTRFAQRRYHFFQRWLFEKVVTPRYLRTRANTFVLEQDGQPAGFGVAEQEGEVVTLADFAVLEGFDPEPLLRALLAETEALARARGYAFVRVMPLQTNPDRLTLFRHAGYQLIDYFLWSFVGETAPTSLPDTASLRPLSPQAALERRIEFLRRELDASHVPDREVIEATLFPVRPVMHRSFLLLQDDQPMGFVSARPNERGDGALLLSLALDPACWGAPLETTLIQQQAAQAGRQADRGVRVLVSTTLHADRSEAALADIGLRRELDYRPVLSKRISS